ncbi:MAG: thioredoxin domain-containing protein [Candidatus Parcubacteria bacterium]|nr:thioredoxin domain-containing protein [Candidatus Parcubacteria bacterium]
MNRKYTAILTIGVILIAGAIIYFIASNWGKPAYIPELTEKDHFIGNLNAPVTIVEFSDFQCPYCATFDVILQQIMKDYSDNVLLAYKHFPLDQIHQNARPAAEASECAAEQGKFWEFKKGLFENQLRLGSALYGELAVNIGINKAQFDNCVAERKYKSKVEADYQEGMKAGVRGTPTNFINGTMMQGATSYENLKATLDSILQSK